MLQIRQEMGPDARIVRAERIRTGGVAGFFAREHYELTVEVPDAPRPRLGRRRPSSPSASAGAAGAGGAGAQPAAIGTRHAPGTEATGIGLEALLAAADAAEVTVAPSVLAGGGPHTAEPDAEVAAAGSEGTDGADEPRPPTVSTSGDTFAQVLASMQQIVGPAAGEPTDEEDAAELGATPDDAGPDPAAGEPEPAGTDGEEPGAGTVERAGGPAGSERTGPPPPGLEPERGGSSVNALLELGIPTRLLVGFADPKASVPLSVLVRRFDPPPSVWLAPGRVVLVAGEGDTALATARQMAHRVGMDPFDIALAGEISSVPGHGRRIQTAAAAARYRERLDGDALALVAVGVGPSREDWPAAAALIADLQPSQSWAVLDSRRKAVDLRRWLRGVGARRAFDAVAAVSTFDAQAPGTVLNVGTPVGWVDGLPASPVVWAAVLSERLADDAHWD